MSAADKIEMQGYPVGCAVWTPFAQAPTDGRAVHVLRKSGKVQHARFNGLCWVRSDTLIRWKLKEAGDDPVTHFHA